MLKLKWKSKPTRLVFGKSRFKHTFGGPPLHKGATPRGSNVPLHRLLTLDLTDPLIPIEKSKRKLRFIPLYYPLRYAFGGGEAQYQVISDSRIKLVYLNAEQPDQEVYPFMQELPERPFRLEPFTYEQFRALLIHENGGTFQTSPADSRHLQQFDYEHLVQIGGEVQPVGNVIIDRCRNPNCERARDPSPPFRFSPASAQYQRRTSRCSANTAPR